MSNTRLAPLRLLIAASILICCIGCDQATKNIATQHLKDLPPRTFLFETVRLEYALNSGGFLSLGSNLSPLVRQWIFIGVNSCLMLAVVLVLMLNRRLTGPAFVCLTLILSGGIGNLIDRVSNQGLVTDFLVLRIGPISTGVFNVADIAVTVGGILALYLSMFGTITKPPDDPSVV